MVGKSPQPPLDGWFELLSNQHRRKVLFDLLESNPQYIHPGCTDDRDRSWCALGELYHVHLPKLADANVIEWDRKRGVVSRGPQYDDIRHLLELLTDEKDSIEDPNDFASR